LLPIPKLIEMAALKLHLFNKLKSAGIFRDITFISARLFSFQRSLDFFGYKKTGFEEMTYRLDRKENLTQLLTTYTRNPVFTGPSLLKSRGYYPNFFKSQEKIF